MALARLLGGLAAAAVAVAGPGGAALRAQAPADPWPAGASAVPAALARFLVAFENLDWAPFRASFDDSATVFFPAPEPPERARGRAAYETRFRAVFAAIRRAAPAGPPYHRLPARDLRVERLGPGAALVTFELRNAERTGRRTLVFREGPAGWRIAHLHASNAAPPGPL